jgi:hypothetical protein
MYVVNLPFELPLGHNNEFVIAGLPETKSAMLDKAVGEMF